MSIRLSPFPIIVAKLREASLRLRFDQRGTIAVMMAILLPLLVGVLGLGFEFSNWYLKTRAMQNAADAAAIAAASNDGTDYALEAKAVAAKYGFVDGSNNVSVTASNAATCPNGPNIVPPCYSVAISSVVPLYLSEVLGFQGNTTVNGGRAQTLSALAIADNNTIKQPICLLALDTTGTALRTNGAPNSDFTGCTVMSNSDATCNGSNLEAYYGLAAGTNTACGIREQSNVPTVSDPYLQYAGNIPKDPCGGNYPGLALNGSMSISNMVQTTQMVSPTNTVQPYAAQIFCGNVKLGSNVTIHTPSDGGVIVIENGTLDLNGFTLSMADTNSSVTLVFSGTNGGNVQHIPTDSSNGAPGGILNIRAPSDQDMPFPGIAIYQDPSLTTGVDLKYTGMNPQWLVSGGVYLPNADVTISGDVAQATNGADCFMMTAKTVLINGTSNIYQQTPDGSGCQLQGLNVPSATILGRGALVY